MIELLEWFSTRERFLALIVLLFVVFMGVEGVVKAFRKGADQ